jgi:putative SbcD/Mre11-related phosphoesterase
MTGLVSGPDDWWLAPEGAAVHPGEATAVVADVHLGYEWARARGGDCVPAHSLAETRARLARLFTRCDVTRLVVAGDLVESRRFCRRTARDVVALTGWLSNQGVSLVWLAGNHDPPRRPALPTMLDVAGWTVAHGHRPLDAPRTVTGHHHPVLRASGLSAPCFLVSETSIVLPAFSPNAAGAGLSTLDASLTRLAGASAPRCVASSGGELLDFGPVGELMRVLAASSG